MNPIELIFQSISNLTGGLITDLTTAIIGLLFLSFLAMAFDHIFFLLDRHVTRTANYNAANKAFNDWDEVKKRNVKSRVDLDLAEARYKSAISRYSKDY